jgi:hypothetical protein
LASAGGVSVPDESQSSLTDLVKALAFQVAARIRNDDRSVVLFLGRRFCGPLELASHLTTT